MTEWRPYVPPPDAAAEPVEPRWTEPFDAPASGAAFDRMSGETAEQRARFDRSFRNRLYGAADGWISITELDDDFHSMRIGLRIAADGTIVEAGGRMVRNPYETCPRALLSLEGLVGANIARPGAHRQIRDRIPRTEGCLHVADMLVVAFRAFRIAKGHDIEPSYEGEETRRRLLAMLPQMRDTCLSFAVRRD